MDSDIFSQLARFKGPLVFNPWRDADPLDVVNNPATERLNRLKAHFSIKPKLLLLGEAPGYQGCHFSGIPFTNEKLLLSGSIPRIEVHGRITSRRLPWSEPSATIVWKTLYELKIAEQTVLWNTFAWHPHKSESLYSNRTPTSAELEAGLGVLKAVIDFLNPQRVVAVGKIAERTLMSLGIHVDGSVRHPAMGGASAFNTGLKKLIKIQR